MEDSEGLKRASSDPGDGVVEERDSERAVFSLVWSSEAQLLFKRRRTFSKGFRV